MSATTLSGSTTHSAPAAPPEEIAGPPVFAPVTRATRLSSIDVLRGVALMGILMINIDGYGNVSSLHDIPIGTAIPTLTGPHAHWNLVLLWIKWMVFEGKMRSIFSMLFGAGVILLTERMERRGQKSNVGSIYLRRNVWLLCFGLIHFVFIWDEDILLNYAIAALLVLYPCRKLKQRTLFILSGVATVLATLLCFFLFHFFTQWKLEHAYRRAEASVRARGPLTAQQQIDISAWHAELAKEIPTQAEVDKKVAYIRSASYMQGIADRVKLDPVREIIRRTFALADNLSAMLLGMGLFRMGFLTLEMATPTYVWTLVLGLTSSCVLYAVGLLGTQAGGYSQFAFDAWLSSTYWVDRELGAVATTAAVMLCIRYGVMRPLQTALEAVGRTALSNYLGTSLLCQFLFMWGPWKLFGKLEYYQLPIVVVGVWVVNIVASTLWLRYFEFGPLEWLWRSLTYNKLQHMRIAKTA